MAVGVYFVEEGEIYDSTENPDNIHTSFTQWFSYNIKGSIL